MIAARQAPLAVGLGTLVSSGALFFINPASGIFPACPSQMFFGIDCPACGGIRGTYALLHGDFVSAADHNVLLLVFFPGIVIAWLFWATGVWDRWGVASLVRSHAALITYFIVILVITFTILRNFLPYLGSGLGS